MRSFLLLNLFILSVSGLIAQSTPTLVTDYATGEESAFEQFENLNGTYLGDDLIFPLANEAHGMEIGLLRNGELSLLKDINPGSDGSQPSRFFSYNDHVYFIAYNDTDRFSLWRTDGTEAGTEVVYSTGSSSAFSFDDLVVSRAGGIYFTFQRDLYYYSEESDNVSVVYEDIEFKSSSIEGSKNYVRYGDGIAFVDVTAQDEAKLIEVVAGSPEEIATLGGVAQFTQIFGMTQVAGGLIFGFNDTDNPTTNGTYRYDAATGSIINFTVAGVAPDRIEAFGDEQRALAFITSVGYYTTNGITGDEELLLANNFAFYPEGESIKVAKQGNRSVFLAAGGILVPDQLIYADGTPGGAAVLTDLSTFQSALIKAGDYAFFADGTSGFSSLNLYAVNLLTSEYEQLYTFPDPSASLNTVRPLGVQNNRLYFASTQDLDLGYELYYIDLSFTVTTPVTEQRSFPHELLITPTTYEVRSETDLSVDVNIFTADGRMVQTKRVRTNQTVSTSGLKSGFYVLQFTVEGKTTSRKVIR